MRFVRVGSKIGKAAVLHRACGAVVFLLAALSSLVVMAMDDKQKIEFRCLYCNKLLGYVSGDSEVKCNRCGALNLLDADTGEIDCIPRKDEKHRITSSGSTFR